jgi:hypothetical protein
LDESASVVDKLQHRDIDVPDFAGMLGSDSQAIWPRKEFIRTARSSGRGPYDKYE